MEIADRLRVVFHATESAYSAGYPTPVYHNQLFGSQKILWKKKNLDEPSVITSNTYVSIPFIVQIPLVQFPPSSNVVAEGDGLSYHCNYVLSAYLESQTQQINTILQTHKTITYMPFIETRISKRPVSITTFESRSVSKLESSSNCANSDLPSIHASLVSLDFVPGDSIPLTITVQNIQKKSVESLTVKLSQVQTWNRSAYNRKGKTYQGEKIMKQVIAQQNVSLVSEVNDMITPISVSLETASDILPSFSYSPVFSIKYQLQITMKRKGKLWSSNLDLMEMPINIGTLGYGIRSSEEIKIYSSFKSIFDSQQEQHQGESSSLLDPVLPVPKFLEVIEYEESLPVYSNDRLPPYDPSLNMVIM